MVLGLVACKSRSDCENVAAYVEPPKGPWTKHSELIPPTGKACGTTKTSPEELLLDFGTVDPKPGLEALYAGKGFQAIPTGLKDTPRSALYAGRDRACSCHAT